MADKYNDVKKIIQDLYDEFLKEEKNLNEIYSSNSVRIDELDQKILSLKKSEDVDFKVFSPRNSSNVNSDKILDYEKDKEKLSSENRNYYKQLRYYSDKVGKLKEALTLLGEFNISEPLKVSAFIDVPDEVIVEKTIDPFDELFPSRNKSLDSSEPDPIISDSALNVDSDTSIDKDTPDSLLNNNIENNIELLNDMQFNFEDEVNSIIHKAEFTEKIITSDTIRAKLEIKEIIRLLRDLFNK